MSKEQEAAPITSKMLNDLRDNHAIVIKLAAEIAQARYTRAPMDREDAEAKAEVERLARNKKWDEQRKATRRHDEIAKLHQLKAKYPEEAAK